ncbi:hypothetical protein AAG906_026272 [Vitis piasezkii]
MGFMNVLKFSAACFDILAWPLFALGYPLCASIRAIETNSISDFRKLVAYWVLFSLISLFDHAFAKLLEWVPFWPYIKLMVICWLVIRQFDGSFMSINTYRENFLVSADQYIKENGPEALEKLLARKWKCEEPNVAQKEIQVVKVTEIKNGGDGAKRCEWPNAAKEEVKVTEVTQRTFGGTAQWVKQTEINLGETRSNTTSLVAAEIEACRDDRTPRYFFMRKSRKSGLVLYASSQPKLKRPSIPTFKGPSRKRHQATSEQLRAKNQATKTNCSPSASMAKKSDQSTKEEQPKCTSNNLNSKNNGISAASTVKKLDETKDDEQQKSASSNGPNQKNNKKQEVQTNEQGHQKNLRQTGDGMKELRSWCNICNQLSELWCSNCNVRCNSEVDMASHRNGRRHLEQLKERLGLWCSICSVSCNSKVDMDSHLNGKSHLDQIKDQLRLWCGACNTTCKSERNMAFHLNGRKHLEKKGNT